MKINFSYLRFKCTLSRLSCHTYRLNLMFSFLPRNISLRLAVQEDLEEERKEEEEIKRNNVKRKKRNWSPFNCCDEKRITQWLSTLLHLGPVAFFSSLSLSLDKNEIEWRFTLTLKNLGRWILFQVHIKTPVKQIIHRLYRHLAVI